MAQLDMSMIASALSFICSVCTIAVGIVYLFDKVQGAKLRTDCALFAPDCNVQWRKVFTLNPIVLLDSWTPIILGFLGTQVHVKAIRIDMFMPTNYIQYAFLMLITAIFADLGYSGMFGVLVGVLSLVASICCVVAKVMGDSQVKQLAIN
eukprot:CAMPEP_0194512442 /NCGR_PEP_ID=MMETSP0253-20130528/44442_1 /TAXON_ID=2966 /ORGANISM="Noctiluca scintillans" /LENGTH=149 /DNA_ID=CAMNT_0039355893 /DNA_START=31 /DNA_END=480 /DNA_ORIENTATION=+